jgi:hypothetical protein
LREKISVTELRKRSESWLRQARRVIAPSADTASRLHNYFALTIDVRPHTVPIGPPMRQGPALSKIVRVAVIGAIGEHKGYQVLLKCARDAKKRGLPLEFVVIGYTENDKPLTDTGKVLVSGRYAEGEASHLLRRENPDVAFLPSVYPETWCYALDEAVAVGLPVVAFDLGAIAERVREMGGGVILPLGEEPGRINDRLVEFAARPGFSDHQDEDMSQGIPDSSNMSNTTPDKDSAPPDALTASVQVLPLPAGLYLFSVKSAPTPADRPQGQLRLPAMHVGLGPGVRSEQVEFVTGPSTDGAWLFAQDDMLVTKVSSVGATLILTSVRAPGGEVLSIKVERLENRADATAADGPMAADSAAKTPADSGRKSKSEAAVVPTEDGVLPLKIGVHVRARGDLSFSDAPWAGRLAPGLWIESFSIRPLLQFEPSDIEYKGLTGSGFETPWLSDEKPCGTKGMAVPLVAFAVRLRPSAQTASYDCEYSGYFKSGVTIGPLRNGAPCRSTLANDPLEGIQVRISKRLAATVPAVAVRDVKTVAAASSGPTFGRYRDEPDAATGSSTSKSGNGAGHKSKAAAKSNLVPTAVSANLKQPAPKNPETNGAKTSAQRAASRRT